MGHQALIHSTNIYTVGLRSSPFARPKGSHHEEGTDVVLEKYSCVCVCMGGGGGRVDYS